MTDPAPLREAIARLIEPSAWEFHDRHKASPVMAAEIAFETRPSLAKADRILAALPTDAVQPVGGVDREAIARDSAKRILSVNFDFLAPDIEPSEQREFEDSITNAILALYATAPTAGSGWLPIESAPKDGTAVDLLVNGDRWPDYAWNEKRGAWTKEIGYPTRTSVLTTKPSHYFIAPAAPTVGEE